MVLLGILPCARSSCGWNRRRGRCRAVWECASRTRGLITGRRRRDEKLAARHIAADWVPPAHCVPPSVCQWQLLWVRGRKKDVAARRPFGAALLAGVQDGGGQDGRPKTTPLPYAWAHRYLVPNHQNIPVRQATDFHVHFLLVITIDIQESFKLCWFFYITALSFC